MDEIDEWTVGPIPIRPAPGPAAPRPSPDDAAPPRSVAGTPDPGLIREPSRRFGQASGPKTQAQGAVACPYARDSGHASVAVEGAVPGQHAVRSSRARADPSGTIILRGRESGKRARRTRGRRRHPSRDPRHPPCRRHRLLFGRGSMLVSAIAGGCVVAAGRVREAKAAEQSRDRCESSLGRLSSARRELDKAMEEAERTSKTDPKTVKDPKTIDRLNRAASVKTPGMVSCDASDVDGLDTAAVKADRSAKTAKTSVKAIRTAVKAVEASKLDKTVDDASRLLKDSEGKVQDARTRETLSKAIKARDAVAIVKAVKAVNDSKAAKEKADAEAKAKAEQEAAKRKAEEESAAEPQQSQNVQRQTAGTGQGRAQRQESVQTPSTTQRQQQSSTPSAPSWSVPSENDDGGMPDTDPGL